MLTNEIMMNRESKNVIFFENDRHTHQTEYRYEPCDALKLAIRQYLILECKNSMVLETLPSTSFSLNYILRGNIHLTQNDGSTIKLPEAVSFGITQKFFHFTFSDFATLFVVIFNPGFASTITDKPLNEFFERFIPMDEFFDNKTNLLMLEQLRHIKSHKKMIDAIESFLTTKIAFNTIDNIIYDSISEIKRKKGQVCIKELTTDLPISRDTFEKRFRHLVGTTPKKYASIVRFRSLFENPVEHGRLTDIALDAGYYDQSHFIKDFKSCTGKLPSDCFNRTFSIKN
ncbi:helix-turn-helix domain-containing protein [Sphingobacterium hungaricum]|uniref:HTH araC/xylS-type domain-containing protein n=1 Tax=Sphingobacterium hungaricum TaxID=2082723 RepID=A0A928UVU7_9SPHI|nr:helix-turn-helix domain-containing protein [Sphingobacterium hungaricum]MBE8712074.1 hypothetical protein [Sphingobacterium hungaricum]